MTGGNDGDEPAPICPERLSYMHPAAVSSPHGRAPPAPHPDAPRPTPQCRIQ
ncbi:hypothetical protein AB5I41_13020 [Sphingomonas sp. MMS24-JH45]